MPTPSDDLIGYADINELRKLGVIHEINRLLLHPVGLALEISSIDQTVRFWDCRDDPEGINFQTPDPDKVRAFYKLQTSKAKQRTESLGYWHQPVLDSNESRELIGTLYREIGLELPLHRREDSNEEQDTEIICTKEEELDSLWTYLKKWIRWWFTSH